VKDDVVFGLLHSGDVAIVGILEFVPSFATPSPLLPGDTTTIIYHNAGTPF
jgi:hypothetical protein